MEKNNKLELRMYGLVPYQLSGIQKGIQFGHAVVRYSLKNNNQRYRNWAKHWETFIILNGGTTNNNLKKSGTLNIYASTLKELGIKTAEMYEPDLGDQLTAVVFILDERVFNKEKYPDYAEWSKDKLVGQSRIWRKQWLKLIGGEKNEKIRAFISKFKLA